MLLTFPWPGAPEWVEISLISFRKKAKFQTDSSRINLYRFLDNWGWTSKYSHRFFAGNLATEWVIFFCLVTERKKNFMAVRIIIIFFFFLMLCPDNFFELISSFGNFCGLKQRVIFCEHRLGSMRYYMQLSCHIFSVILSRIDPMHKWNVDDKWINLSTCRVIYLRYDILALCYLINCYGNLSKIYSNF